jgi:hypothetical protein
VVDDRRRRRLGMGGTSNGKGVVANMCEGELILCFANIQFFLQFFEVSEVSNGEWVAQKLTFV